MPPAHPATNERRAIVALFVMFALLVQALIPTMAMAAATDGSMVLCTVGGTQTISTDGKAAPAAPHRGPPCHDCLAATLAAAAPPPVLDTQPVAYAVACVEHTPPSARIVPSARAPPRPPGQGPPTD